MAYFRVDILWARPLVHGLLTVNIVINCVQYSTVQYTACCARGTDGEWSVLSGVLRGVLRGFSHGERRAYVARTTSQVSVFFVED